MPSDRVHSRSPWHVVLILDDSTSMKGPKVESLNHAMKAMVGEMRLASGGIRPYFRVSVVKFGNNADILAEAVSEMTLNVTQISSLSGDSGTTNATEAFERAEDVLRRHPGQPTDFEPFVFFFSDGQPDNASTAIVAADRVKKRVLPSGIPRIISIGIGDVNDDFMRKVATSQGGEARYRKLADSRDIEHFFPAIGTHTVGFRQDPSQAADQLAGIIATSPGYVDI